MSLKSLGFLFLIEEKMARIPESGHMRTKNKQTMRLMCSEGKDGGRVLLLIEEEE